MNVWFHIVLASLVVVISAVLIGWLIPDPWSLLLAFLVGCLIGYFWIGAVIIEQW